MPSLLFLYTQTLKTSLPLPGLIQTIIALQKLTWTVLPKGFRDGPPFFGQALASDLTSLDLTPSTVLQRVDDLLLCSPSLTHSQQHITQLLNFLSARGHRVSPPRFSSLFLESPIPDSFEHQQKDMLLAIESPLCPPYHFLHQEWSSCPPGG